MAASMEELRASSSGSGAEGEERDGEDSSAAVSLATLPDELLLRVLRFLPTVDLLSVRNVSRRFRAIVEDPSLWSYRK